ncbi:MAG: PDR/VanB family oxidoreductase [Burkholderiaceae bacterium]
MKTCPWNLEGLLGEAVVRRFAMAFPGSARYLAALDDSLGRGAINPVKKWWWDIELDRGSGRYVRAAHVNARGLSRALRLRYADQTLAAYPADRMPPPYPVAFPVDREEGIARYRALLTPAEYRRRLARGETDGLAPAFVMPKGEAPVFPVRLQRRDEMGTEAARYEFVSDSDNPLPPFTAGAHIDVVIAPEYLRQYSLAGDPDDRSRYVLGVRRETEGRGGSMLMHRTFRPGRRVFVSRPINHFELVEDAAYSVLLAGGIGVTPLLTMAHRLHALGSRFEFHYSVASRADAAFVADIESAPWRDQVRWHVSDEGTRAVMSSIVPTHHPGWHLYACGSSRFMDAISSATAGWPSTCVHNEYFAAPEAPERIDHPFRVRLARQGVVLAVPAEKSIAEVLIEHGIAVELKCADGICGVCAADYDAAESGPVSHRDYVLGARDRVHRIVLCCSRAERPDDTLVLDI